MSLLTHQSFANTDTPYWASANAPTSLVSPLSVIDTYGAPAKKVVVTANTNGTGGVFYANEDGTNPFGVGFAQGITQPGNQIVLDVGNVNPVLVATSSNVVSSQPIVIDSALNAQNFTITPKANGVELAMGGAGGGDIVLLNAPLGSVAIMSNTIITSNSLVVADNLNNDATLTSTKLQFGNGAGNVGQVGLSGSSAYLGTFTAPVTTPGVLVNISNGCELQFTDASANVYGMKTTAGVLTISAPGNASAITMASTGQVTIPDIISGSFVPIGGIIMFSGNPLTLPANWKVCDGTSGTPDLRNQFIIGAGTFASGTSGGSAFIATSNLPAHNHGVTDPGHIHGITDPGHFHTTTAMGEGNEGQNGLAFGRLGNNGPNNSDTKTTGITINSAVTGITTNNTGGGAAYYPPYYALAYIIRVA